MSRDVSGNWRIDVHHHVVPPQYVDSSIPVPIPDIETQLRTMDGWKIRTAITSLTPRVLEANPRRLRETARRCNEFQAKLVRDHPSRFGSFALLPLPDVDGALQELAYALDALRLDGVGLFASAGGRYLGDPSFDPVFAELNRRKATVFLHPSHCKAPEHANLRVPDYAVEYVFDTTRAIVNLLYTGTLKRCPDMRLIAAHGGGAVPFLAHRISTLETHPRGGGLSNVIPTLQSLYYDTACATAAYALRSLQELVDATHILWGSDLPFFSGERLQAEVDHWEAYDGFDAASRSAVERLNALRLFPRLAPRAARRHVAVERI